MDPVFVGCALALAGVHVLAGRLHLAEALAQPGWLSAAGGASMAYVFAHLLPEVAGYGGTLAEAIPLGEVEHHVWWAALLGLVAFYGVERLAARHRAEDAPARVFGPHLAAFAAYSAAIGLLLHRDTGTGLLPFALGVGLHLAVHDGAMLRHHRQRYLRVGRWVLAAALLAGAALGAVVDLPETATGLTLAVFAGAVILNAVKEELPAERDGRFGPFLGGAVAFAALHLLVESM